MRNAIITFVRKPELGKVKTRLAADVGNEKALQVYKLLLQHTHTVVDEVIADKFIFYTEVVEYDMWNGYYKLKQAEGDLGIKISSAFDFVFKLGYDKVAIIGSDCIELEAAHIKSTFKMLEENEVVVGPCYDGGYYLIAIKQPMPHLFQNINWSTETVFEETVKQIGNEKYFTLPTLHDIDTVEDFKCVSKLAHLL